MSRLPSKYFAVVLPLIISGLMSLLISGISTFKAIGLVSGFISQWFLAWVVSWAVAFPCLVFVLPLARRLAAMISEPPERS